MKGFLRHIRRWIRIGANAVLILCALGIATLWFRSWTTGGDLAARRRFDHTGDLHTMLLYSGYGILGVRFDVEHYGGFTDAQLEQISHAVPRWNWRTEAETTPPSGPFATEGRVNFWWRRRKVGNIIESHGGCVPHSAALCIASLPLAAQAYGSVRRRLIGRRRRARGLCPQCGYDRRATPGRCPECGAAPSPPARFTQTERSTSESST
jgi:hypothetical protein